MPKITAVSKPRWSIKPTPQPHKRKVSKKPHIAFEDVLHVYMLKLISECN